MINSLFKSLLMDITYSTNSFLYSLRKLPVFNDLITNDIYSSKILKKIVSIIVIIILIGKSIFLKFMYFFFIFMVSYQLDSDNLVKNYFHIYFLLTILGLFINNKSLNTSKKKYYSLFIFKIDATSYFRYTLCWNQAINLILNSICIFFFGYLLSCPLIYSISLITFTFFIRWIGEALNIIFYKKYNYVWYSNTRLYTILLLVMTSLLILPIIKVYVPLKIILLGTLLSIFMAIPAILYLYNIKDYKLVYKKLSQSTDVMNSKNEKDYFKQAMVAVREKDRLIDEKKIKGKKGYELFNTIFFERHKEILVRSAKKYSLILLCIYLVIAYLTQIDPIVNSKVNTFLNQSLGWFVVIMYFINRGAIITQAMFFNCDHAMLTYNFYKEPDILLGLFRKRLKTVIKVNLLPAFIIGVGNIVLLLLTNTNNYLTLTTTFLFIIFLSIFFSVHYLVIYYLLQPFNKELEVKKVSYSLVTLFTYIISYQMTGVIVNSNILSIIGLLATTTYIIISLILVYKLAPKTFKLN